MTDNGLAEELFRILKERGFDIDAPIDRLGGRRCHVATSSVNADAASMTAMAAALANKIGQHHTVSFGQLPLPEGATSAVIEEFGGVIVRRINDFDIDRNAEMIRWDMTFDVR